MSGEGTIEQVLAGGKRWCVVRSDWQPVLAALPDQSVDHVLTDPPFSEHVHTRQRRLTFPDSATAPSRALTGTGAGSADDGTVDGACPGCGCDAAKFRRRT